jgi:hypothetical protein
MKDKQILIKNCPLCEIFTKKKINSKLYWPETIDEIPETEFVIVECLTCKIPMVVLGEHITTIPRECWGRILYRCRKIFGGGITLRTKPRKIFDHWHAHIINIKKY